jgi:hypothetical protein
MNRRFLMVAGLVCALLFGGEVAAFAEEPASPTTQTVRLEDDDLRVVFSGTWRHRWNTASSGWSHRSSNTKGSSFRVRFDGTGVTLLSPKAPDGGVARISLDGSVVATVSLYAAERQYAQEVWAVTGLSPGEHTLLVTCSGTKEPASTGTWIVLDALVMEGRVSSQAVSGVRTVQQSDSRLYRKGTWKRRTSSSASGDSAVYATAKGASVTIRFKGTEVAWTGRKSAASGQAEVLLDGRRVAVVGGAPGEPRERRILWAVSGLANREHTVVIRSLGRPSDISASSGTAVDVDTFRVRGSVLQAYRPTPFSYPWRTYIVIDKSQFKLYWVKDGMLRKVYPIAHGKVGWTTPNRIWRIDAKYHSSGVYGPRKMRMFKQVRTSSGTRYVHTAYAIHGTNQEWVIGTRASHGCIRMYNKDVLELFPQVPLGTMVVTRD